MAIAGRRAELEVVDEIVDRIVGDVLGGVAFFAVRGRSSRAPLELGLDHESIAGPPRGQLNRLAVGGSQIGSASRSRAIASSRSTM